MPIRATLWVPLAAWIFAASHAGAADPEQRAQRERGWQVLRAMDCARCHGRDHDGWAAPSLIAGVRDGSRERFDRWVLDGDIARGMPGYRSQPLVVAELDAIHAYLLARARGEIGPGRPGGAAPAGDMQAQPSAMLPATGISPSPLSEAGRHGLDSWRHR